ncbi:MAG: hypothetical protein ABFC63_01640 [Thermoguttaceae bacterium]
MSRAVVVLVGGLLLFQAAQASAQDVLSQAYGLGVHAYFASDYSRAYEQLTSAIDGGSKDPRAFYFRGFAYMKLGRPTEAATDFRKGADLESKDVNNFFNVGKSLERVQGAARLEVEKYRTAARMSAYEQTERLRKARYEALRREESRVLREQSQGSEGRPKAGSGNAVPPSPAPGDGANPFGSDESEAQPGDNSNPFGDAPAEEPKGKKKGGGVAGSVGRSIGKGIAGEEKKPGKDKPADKKATDKSKKAEKAPAEDDPFGEAPAKDSSEKKPAEKKPAEKKADEKPVDPSDPFGP